MRLQKPGFLEHLLVKTKYFGKKPGFFNWGPEYLGHHPYPENIFWVIEYSNSSQDSTVKYRIYAEAGISEYWLVNLQRQELIIFRDPRDGEYGSKITLTEGEITPLAFADIQILVEALILA